VRESAVIGIRTVFMNQGVGISQTTMQSCEEVFRECSQFFEHFCNAASPGQKRFDPCLRRRNCPNVDFVITEEDVVPFFDRAGHVNPFNDAARDDFAPFIQRTIVQMKGDDSPGIIRMPDEWAIEQF